MCVVQGVLNEGRTGPFVEPPATREEKGRKKKKLKVEECVSVENVSLKDGNISFTAVSLPGIYFTMAHSAAGDALAYSDGATLKGHTDIGWKMKHSTETNHVRQDDVRTTLALCGTCTGTPVTRGFSLTRLSKAAESAASHVL